MWKYNNSLFNPTIHSSSNIIGFIYCITNKINSKKYIGKKLFIKRSSYQKNKKRKKKTIESDWKNYYGSNKELLEDIKIYGKENFEREILRLCISRSECNYYELREQIIRDVLLSNEYYNSFIGTRIHKKHIIKTI